MVVLTFHITRIIKGEIRPGRSLCRGERIIILLLGLISLLTGCGGLPTGTLLYESRMMMKVIRTETTIVVQNVSGDPLAIRISWDEQDHDGTGRG